MGFKIWISIVLLALLAVLIVQNAQPVTVRFLVWSIQAPEIAAILILVLVGFSLGFLAAKTGKKR